MRSEEHRSFDTNWLLWTIGAVCGVVLLRILVLWSTPTDLFFDEAQYWAWGQDLAFGYFSKPPLIGWVIRFVTELAGSIDAFWVRLPAPVFHGITAIIIGMWMRQMEPRAALPATLIYLSMPIISIGSWMVSTDTIMAPFLALGTWFWWRSLRDDSLGFALASGLCIGLAMMAKYAGFYFWVGAVVACLHPGLRPRPLHLGLALLACLLVLAPNLIWNLQNGLITFSHTADNVDWVREDSGISLNIAGALEFLLNQVGVIGPVFFVIWFFGFRQFREPDTAFLLAFSIPVLLLVTGQALLARAFGNWAFAAYIAAAPLVAMVLVDMGRRGFLIAGLVVNVALSLLLVTLIVAPHLLPRATERYMQRAHVAQTILAAAEGRDLLATRRDMLADLTYYAHGTARVFAPGPNGAASNYYEMVSQWDGQKDVVVVTSNPELCAADPMRTVVPEGGAYKGRTIYLFGDATRCDFGRR